MTSPHETGRDALTPGQPLADNEVKIERMYYTLCQLCGALNDWSDSMPEARRLRRAHLVWHRRNSGS